MKLFFNTKTILGGVVVAIVGSALWENIFRDIMNWSGKFLLTVSTLGIQKYKDDIYINISHGFYEGTSLLILSLATSILCGFIFAFALIIFKEKDNKEKNESKNYIIKEWLKNHKFFSKLIFLIYSLFVVGVIILSFVKIEYINRSIAYYNQLKNIASPYLTLEQEKVFNSKFAQIKNKEDYVQLTKDLVEIIGGEIKDLPKAPAFIF